MIALNPDINSYHEPKTVLDSAKLLSTFIGSLKGFFFLLLLLPVLPILKAIAILYYPIVLLGLAYVKSTSTKLLEATQLEYKGLNFKDTIEYYSKVQTTLDRLKSVKADSKETDVWFLKPINKRVLVIQKNFSEIENILRKTMFIDTSNEEYTDKEKALFADLTDFYGKDEAYKEDTFHQLKKESA